MQSVSKLLFWFLILGLRLGLPLGQTDAATLDGTMWMYEHESGLRHYVAFYGNYHYLNSSGPDSYADSFWLRSISPYFSHINSDGSITYSSMHISPAAWAINWGRCDIDANSASFHAAGMLYSVFIYNRNEPYVLLSTNWHPPSPLAGSSFSLLALTLPDIFLTIFGQ